MRNRKEIMDESSPKGWSLESINTSFILEVLLDIRELLEDIKEE